MATEEVYRSLVAVREAEVCLQRCQADIVRSRQQRDEALARQDRLRQELAQIDRSLNLAAGGQSKLGGPAQSRFPTGGGQAALTARRKELRALLTARPDQVAPPPSAPMGRFV